MLRLSLLLCAVASAVACGGGETSTAGAPDVIEGVVTDVTSEGLGSVTGFTVKDGQETFEIAIDPERDYGFNLDHLNEHRTTGDPVRVELETKDGEPVAITIDDA